MPIYKIAIIGGGPAGCTLARLLLHKNVDVEVVVFEGEEGLDARSQGGTLDLHTKSGIQALKDCGLFDEFAELARFDGEAFRLCNKHFQSFVAFGGTTNAENTRGRPEIDRIQLRRILVDSLPKDVLRWDHHLNSIEDVQGTYQLHFRNQPTETGFDLVVGADGCWSHVRALLTDDKPHYSGISGFQFSISNPQERCPELYARVARGSLFSFGDGKALMVQQLGTGALGASVWALKSEDWIKQFDKKLNDLDLIKQVCLEEHKDWDPRLREIIEHVDGAAAARNLYMLPVGNTWKHRAGVTLLGDAAHVMTPFAGEGVNLAMSDSLALASRIESACAAGKLDADIRTYEEELFKRARRYQRMTYDMMNATFFDEGGLDRNVERYVLTAAADEVPEWLYPAFKIGVLAYFWFWRWFNVPPKVERA